MDPGTIAFLVALGSGLFAGVAGGAARDIAHIAKGREGPLPSQEAADRRAEKVGRAAGAVTGKNRKNTKNTKKGGAGKPKDGYLRRLVGNAAEQRRAKNAGRRKADKDWLEAHRDEFSDAGYRAEQAKLDRKAGRRARRERAFGAFRDADRGRIKAALAARKSDTGKRDKEVVDEQDQGEDATVLPFRQRETDTDATRQQQFLDDAVADEAALWDAEGERVALVNMPDSVLQTLARRDGDERQAAAREILVDRGERGVSVTPDSDVRWHVHDDGQVERVDINRGPGSAKNTSNTGTRPIPTEEEPLMSTPTAPETNTAGADTMPSGEITNLGQAQHFARQCTSASTQMQSTADAQRAAVENTCQDLAQQLARLEMAQAHFTHEGMHDTAGQMAIAQEQVQAMLTAARGVRDQWQQLMSASEAAKGAFETMQGQLDPQSGITEQVQAHSGNVATRTDYYTPA